MRVRFTQDFKGVDGGVLFEKDSIVHFSKKTAEKFVYEKRIAVMVFEIPGTKFSVIDQLQEENRLNAGKTAEEIAASEYPSFTY